MCVVVYDLVVVFTARAARCKVKQMLNPAHSVGGLEGWDTVCQDLIYGFSSYT